VATPPVEPRDLRGLCALAEAAALDAGSLLAGNRASFTQVLREPARDLKLAADVEAETRILDRLRRESGLSILSEERGVIEGRAPGSMRWIVDPLDGTINYARGIGFAAVSIALWDGDAPLLGVVHDFGRKETFSGIVGLGAWADGTQVQVSDVREPSRAVLSTGFPVSTDFSTDGLRGFIEQVRRYKKVRLLGSAALSLAYVASGRVDAYVERDIKIWDVAAGLAIVRAAGGLTVWKPTGAEHTLTVYAGAPGLPALVTDA
jgi:myo-inositol-1(or 4)-monophosphatase